MICRVCLQNSDKSFGFFDEEGIKLQAVEIVTKYFWFEPQLNDEISNTICLLCWTIIKNFHELYIQSEEANFIWIEKLNTIKKDPNIDNLSDYEGTLNGNIAENENNKETSQTIKNVLNESNNKESVNEKTWDTLAYDSDIKPKEEIPECKVEICETSDVSHKRKRGRPSGSKSLTQTIKKKENLTEIVEIANDDKIAQKNQKRSPEEVAAFHDRLAEGDTMIANFTKIFCNVCSVELPNFTSLKTHSSFVHKQKGFIVCCDKKYFKRSKLVDHIEKHINPEKYKCHLCNKISMTRWTLKMHMANVHKSVKTENLTHQCTFCGKAFKLKNVMLRHQLIHVPEEERKYKCTRCDKSYPSQGTLNHHVRTYHDKRYSGMCDICGKTYNNKQDVKRHRLEVHEGAERMKYKCKYCDLLFTTKYLCNRHKFEDHEHHNQVVEQKCKICSKVLSNSEALKSHIQYAHKAKPKFECSLCGKNFKRELVLKEHMAAHTGQPLYACPHCPKTFTHSSNMHHHRKRVHPVEFEEARQLKDDKKESWCKFTALTN